MNKRIIAALAAIVLATMGIVMLVGYASNADERAFEGATLQTVLQVDKSIAADAKSEDLVGSIKEVRLPRKAIAKGALTDLGDVSGKVTTVALQPGEFLMASRFTAPGDKTVKVKSAVPVGMQEMAIPLERERAVAGTIKAGDTIGIVASFDPKEGASFTSLVLNRVLVLAVDNGVVVQNEKAGEAQMITIAVKATAVNQIAHALDFGQVRLTKQNADTDVKGNKRVVDGDVAP